MLLSFDFRNPEDLTLLIIIAFFYLFSIICLVKLWRKKTVIFAKLFWSFILLVPILGPVAYGALFKPPHPWKENEQVKFDNRKYGGGGRS